MNTKPLTVEQRKRVADEVTQKPHIIAYSGDIIIAAYDQHGNRNFVDSWDPEESLEQKYAIISTVARMIKSKDLSLLVKRVNGMDDSAFDKEYAEVVRLYSALGIHIAENNTQEIELLAWELLESKE